MENTMTINVLFKLDFDMDNFYNDFINGLPDIISSAKVKIEHKSVVLETSPSKEDAVEAEKVLINDIKQYMRDNEVSYEITV